MPKIIYVVFGTTGEYSDRTEWAVIAFTDEETAKKRVIAASEKAREIELQIKNGYYHDYSEERALKTTNTFDPKMELDYTGTSYYYLPVELHGE